MLIEVYRVSKAQQLPDGLFWALNDVDTRFIAAFDNYPDTLQYVIAAWGTTGDPEVNGQPVAALVATFGHIITGYIDLLIDEQMPIDPDDWPDDDPLLPLQHNEPKYKRRLAALLARLRKVSRTKWLLVHDADEAESWLEQGFRLVAPPPDIPADEAVVVLAWDELPEDVYALLQARGLTWHRRRHCYPSRYANE
jgi:hypothetical protein